jgi:hypothetical protein
VTRLIAFLTIGAILFNFAGRFVPPQGSREVFDALSRAQKRSGAHVLVLGDSVGRQLFSSANEAPDSMYLTTNMGVSMVGHYILAAKTLESGTPIKSIFVAMIPPAFEHNLDEAWTFSAFCKPFYRLENRKYLSPLVYAQLGKEPYWITLFPLVRHTWIGGSIDYSAHASPVPPMPEFSPVSIEYLQKLRDLAAKKQIDVHFICPPISTLRRCDYRVMRKQVSEARLDDMFTGYFENMQFLDDDKFYDSRHLRIELASSYAREYARRIGLAQ